MPGCRNNARLCGTFDLKDVRRLVLKSRPNIVVEACDARVANHKALIIPTKYLDITCMKIVEHLLCVVSRAHVTCTTVIPVPLDVPALAQAELRAVQRRVYWRAPGRRGTRTSAWALSPRSSCGAGAGAGPGTQPSTPCSGRATRRRSPCASARYSTN